MRGRSVKTIVGALAVALSLAVGGCNTGSEDASGNGDEVQLYGTDGNMANSFGDSFKDSPAGILAGMKGTLPLTPLNEDFKRRLRAIDSGLTDFNYAAEAYDAVVVSGLAAEAGRTVESASISKQIIGVTTGDTSCDSISTCLALVKAGKRIKYKGVSLRRSGFTQTGEPSTAMYGVVTYGRDNHLEDAKTEFISAGDDKGENKTAPPSANGRGSGKTTTPLKIGMLLPHTGGLAFQGPPMFAAVRLAIKELNDAGGVLGAQVQLEDGDDGTSPDVANATVDRLIGAGVHVIIGASASGVSKAVLPKVAAAGKVMISPSATSDELSTLDDKGFFFRTSPPDVLQAKALNDIIMRDGHGKIAIVARDDSYGKGLANNVQANLTVSGIKPGDLKVILYKVKDSYDPKTDVDGIFAPIARDVKAFGADGVLLVGFDESAFVIKALVAAGAKLKT
jgi:ABC-type branched-subunit amino acid transport system substrate-binding protein